jgi:hypothetical protein
MTDNSKRFSKFIVLPFAAIVFIGGLAGGNNKSPAQVDCPSLEAAVPASKFHGSLTLRRCASTVRRTKRHIHRSNES